MSPAGSHVHFDPEADAAYVYVVDGIGPGEALQQVWVEDDRLRGDVILDLDAAGFLLGVEVLGATAQLGPATLTSATTPADGATTVTVTLSRADHALATEAVSELLYELTHYTTPPTARGGPERTANLSARVERLRRLHALLEVAGKRTAGR